MELSLDRFRKRAALLSEIRQYFREFPALEMETPLLNASGSFEAQLDSFLVLRSGVRKSAEAESFAPGLPAGYLITSPEYRLKEALATLRCDMYQIAHCFREGDSGAHHTEEFLMLEWYRVGTDYRQLMNECEALLRRLAHSECSARRLPQTPFPRFSAGELLERYCQCDFRRSSMESALAGAGLRSATTAIDDLADDDLFFLLFLNLVEPQLPATPFFIYDYPAALAALAVVEGDCAQRFELYWGKLELANGYQELANAAELRSRMVEQNQRRIKLGKPEMAADAGLLRAMDRGLPECSGVALGLDRTFLALQGGERLDQLGLLL
ncbi:MAG: elongation factor P--(R)-beta-lysine ligase [Leptospirales bacterium]|nr:elongation factor P--(R)-beta-lysine ligase [Leptospirales bacterium]